MINYLKDLFTDSTQKDTFVALTGTIINSAIGGLFFILAPRVLGPEEYGLFAVVVSTGIMLTSFANFGIDTGILRFVNGQDKAADNQVLRLAFLSYLTIGISTFILGLLFSGPIATYFGKAELTPLLKIAFSGVIFLLLTDFFIANLQARKKFFQATLVNIASNSTRLLIIIVAAAFYTVNVYFLTALFFFVTILSVTTGAIFTPLNFLGAKTTKSHLKDFFTYNWWIAASLAISSIPFDNYFLIKYSGPVATGLFAAPFKVLSIVDQLSGNFSKVLASRLSSLDSHVKVIIFTKKSLPVVAIFSLGFTLSAILAPIIIRVIFGSQYLGSVNVFRIVSISSVFTFATAIPVSILIYYLGKSKIAFYLTAITIISWLFACLILIPRYHEIGAAFAFLVSEVTAFVLFTGYTALALRKK